MNLNDIYPIIKPIEGWLSDRQMQIFYPYVKALPPKSLLVEIGSYHGKSSLFFRLANPDINILTIDPCKQYLVNGKPLFPPKHIDDSVLAHGNIFQICDSSFEVLQTFNWTIDLLYIDGDHTYDGVMDDSLWIYHVAKDGIVMFHDYKSDHKDVETAVNDLIDTALLKMVEEGDTVCVTKKI
jgi:predicted O-methyltransferase YrrM